jgi:hypothetical protein
MDQGFKNRILTVRIIDGPYRVEVLEFSSLTQKNLLVEGSGIIW